MNAKKYTITLTALLTVAGAVAFFFIPRCAQKEVAFTKPQLQPFVGKPVQSLSPAPAAVGPAAASPDESEKKQPLQMSNKELRPFEESSEVMTPVNAFLDEGENMKALYEVRKLLQHPNRNVRLAAVQTLAWIGLPAAMELARVIDDSDEEIRTAAQEAFWKALDQAEKPALKRDLMAEALKSSAPEVRARTLDESFSLPDVLSFSLVASAMNDPDEAVAAMAREKVAFISGERFETREQALVWFEANKDRLQAAATDAEQAASPTVSCAVPTSKPPDDFDYLARDHHKTTSTETKSAETNEPYTGVL